MSRTDIMGLIFIAWGVIGAIIALRGKDWEYGKARKAATIHYWLLIIIAIAILPMPWFFDLFTLLVALLLYWILWRYVDWRVEQWKSRDR